MNRVNQLLLLINKSNRLSNNNKKKVKYKSKYLNLKNQFLKNKKIKMTMNKKLNKKNKK